MLPTLQLVFLDRTEGALDLRLLQLQVERTTGKNVRRDCWQGTTKGDAMEKMCSGGPAYSCHRQVAAHAGRNAMSSKATSLTTILVACLFLLPCLLRLRNQRFSFMFGMVRFVRVMRVL